MSIKTHLAANLCTIIICLVVNISTSIIWLIGTCSYFLPVFFKTAIHRFYSKSERLQGMFSRGTATTSDSKQSTVAIEGTHKSSDDSSSSSSSSSEPYAESIDDICSHVGIKRTAYSCKTADGYILVLMRYEWRTSNSTSTHRTGSSIGKKSENVNCMTYKEAKQPVSLLIHGLMQDGDSFACSGELSLMHKLLSSGVDVWVANNRGTKYSNQHSDSTNYGQHTESYWDFCIDDLAKFDVPAMVNFVLKYTNSSKLSLIGFSQGSAQSFGALSIYPELNDKISVFVALAPAIKVASTEGGFMSHLSSAYPNILTTMFGRLSMLPFVVDWQNILNKHLFERVVVGAMDLLFSWKCEQISVHRRLILCQHVYSTSSVKCVEQWFHVIRKGGHLTTFERETTVEAKTTTKNVQSETSGAGATSPSSLNDTAGHYDIRNIRCPVAVFSGSRDFIVDASCIPGLVSNCVQYHVQEGYEHLDLIWADSAYEHIFAPVAKIIMKYT